MGKQAQFNAISIKIVVFKRFSCPIDKKEKIKMRLVKRKIYLTTTMLLVLAFVTSVFIIFLPAGNAQVPPQMRTYPIIDAIPNPIGVGEQTLLRTGILQPLGTVELGWEDVTIEVVKPDNSTETLGPYKTDSTGSTFTVYTPDQVGTYLLTTHFPEQINPVNFTDSERGGITIPAGTVMLASTSETISLVVNPEPSRFYPGHALPIEYWTRPIDPQLREWYSISGNWVSRPDNSLALYNDDAPETPHVLWAHPITTGGLTGGLWGPGQVPVSSEAGDAYEGKFPGSVILNGILYYQRTDTRAETAPAIIQVDLHTGEEKMFRNNTILSFGQVLYFDSFNYDGVFTYIWEARSVAGNTTWNAYDPFTGNQQIQINNVPSGLRTYGPSGEILIYVIDFQAGWMALWNSTDCGLQNARFNTSDYGSWGNTAHGRALGPGLDGANPRSYTWNVSIPSGLRAVSALGSQSIKLYPTDRVVGAFFNQTEVRIWGLDTVGLNKDSTQSTLLFDQTWSAPDEWFDGTNTIHYTGATDNIEDGVIAVWNKELRKHYGFSVETGQFLWETESENYADAYGWGAAEHTWYFAYDKLFSVGVAGILYAYDLGDGTTVWTYNISDPYSEPVTGNYWWGWITLIADDKVYLGTLEHSAEQPLPRGAPQICIDASNGAEIWRINGMFRNTRWGGNGVIGDSIIATMDTYDQRVYAIGKGPTKTTLAASNGAGGGVTITGFVNDISPGLFDYGMTARFPNGVPAVSDDSQSDWMLYVWKQFVRPNNATGVPVSLDVIDANGNFRNIGTTTSDSNGFFTFSWTPDISGAYTVFATFAGSKAYYGSSSVASFSVAEDSGISPSPTGDGEPGSMADSIILPGIIAIIVVIIIVGVVLAVLVRRR